MGEAPRAGGKTWLAGFHDSAVGQETGTLLRGAQDVYRVSLMRSVVWLRGLVQGSRAGGELLVGPGEPSLSHQRSRQHIIMGLSVSHHPRDQAHSLTWPPTPAHMCPGLGEAVLCPGLGEAVLLTLMFVKLKYIRKDGSIVFLTEDGKEIPWTQATKSSFLKMYLNCPES